MERKIVVKKQQGKEHVRHTWMAFRPTLKELTKPVSQTINRKADQEEKFSKMIYTNVFTEYLRVIPLEMLQTIYKV